MTNYSVNAGARAILENFLANNNLPLNDQVRDPRHTATLVNDGETPPIPCVFPASEGIAAIKGLEGTIASVLASLRFGEPAEASVDVLMASVELFIHNVSEVEGLGTFKFGDPNEGSAATQILTKADLYHTLTDPYRHAVAGMYSTKDGRVFHLHGSLNATHTLRAIGLPPYIKDLGEEDAIKLIQSRALEYTAEELETKAEETRQAGAIVFTPEEFRASPHGQHIATQPLFDSETLEDSSPPLRFTPGGKSILTGIKILDMTRAIAGPVVTRILAEYGADVLHVSHNATIPDSPFLPVFYNAGKHACDLDLKDAADRATFEKLLDEADVVVDGYRPGVMDKLGYGKDDLLKRFKGRGKGFVYLAENCYGWGGPWSHRPGWQQIADSVSGMDWATGRALGKDHPVYPPFAMADYGCGAVGAVAVLNALADRATKGGSYYVTTSLLQFDYWLMSQKPYPEEVWAKNRKELLKDLEAINLHLNTPGMYIFAVVTKTLRRLYPWMFEDRHYYKSHLSEIKATVKTPNPCVQAKFKSGWLNGTRLDGADPPSWRSDD